MFGFRAPTVYLFSYGDNFCVDETVRRKIELDLVVSSLPLTSSFQEVGLGTTHAQEEPAFGLGTATELQKQIRRKIKPT